MNTDTLKYLTTGPAGGLRRRVKRNVVQALIGKLRETISSFSTQSQSKWYVLCMVCSCLGRLWRLL